VAFRRDDPPRERENRIAFSLPRRSRESSSESVDRSDEPDRPCSDTSISPRLHLHHPHHHSGSLLPSSQHPILISDSLSILAGGMKIRGLRGASDKSELTGSEPSVKGSADFDIKTVGESIHQKTSFSIRLGRRLSALAGLSSEDEELRAGIRSLPGSSSPDRYRMSDGDGGRWGREGSETAEGKRRKGENGRILDSLRARSLARSLAHSFVRSTRRAERERMLGAILALSRNRSTCLPGGRQAGKQAGRQAGRQASRHASIRQSRCLKQTAQCKRRR